MESKYTEQLKTLFFHHIIHFFDICDPKYRFLLTFEENLQKRNKYEKLWEENSVYEVTSIATTLNTKLRSKNDIPTHRYIGIVMEKEKEKTIFLQLNIEEKILSFGIKKENYIEKMLLLLYSMRKTQKTQKKI